MKNVNKFDTIIQSILILSIGLIAGYGMGFARAEIRHFPDFELIDDLNQGVTTLQFSEVKNGQLVGIAKGRSVRMAFTPDNIIEIAPDQAFQIPLNRINFPIIDPKTIIPQNAQFAASNQGKYYYSVLDPKVLTLSESNRVFFESAEAAEKAGFIRK